MSKLDEAIAFAAIAHAGQLRKYSTLPYIVHPIEVMELVNAAGGDENMQIAAVLHDVVEDTPVRLGRIRERFGGDVSDLVHALTDQFTKEAFPRLNRVERKRKERARQAKMDPRAQSIKYADLISNTASIIEYDKDFAVVYLREKDALLEVMRDGDSKLRANALGTLARAQTELLQERLKP